jgi:hypothetical protein
MWTLQIKKIMMPGHIKKNSNPFNKLTLASRSNLVRR